MRVVKFKEVQEGCQYIKNCYYLENQEDLGNFIAQEKPKRLDLNRIPLRIWFIFYNDDSGDYTQGKIELIREYIDFKTTEMLEIANNIGQLKEILIT